MPAEEEDDLQPADDAGGTSQLRPGERRGPGGPVTHTLSALSLLGWAAEQPHSDGVQLFAGWKAGTARTSDLAKEITLLAFVFHLCFRDS